MQEAMAHHSLCIWVWRSLCDTPNCCFAVPVGSRGCFRGSGCCFAVPVGNMFDRVVGNMEFDGSFAAVSELFC